MNNTNINDIHYEKLIMFLLLLIKKYYENYFDNFIYYELSNATQRLDKKFSSST